MLQVDYKRIYKTSPGDMGYHSGTPAVEGEMILKSITRDQFHRALQKNLSE
jgi:hypothetical protein